MKKKFCSLSLAFGVFLLALCLANAEQVQVKDGLGKAKLPDSSIYEGNFKNGLFNGKGTLMWRNGDRYEGEFKDGLKNGKGIFIGHGGDGMRGSLNLVFLMVRV